MYLHLQSLFSKYLENLEPIPRPDSENHPRATMATQCVEQKSYTEVHTSDNHQVHHQIFSSYN